VSGLEEGDFLLYPFLSFDSGAARRAAPPFFVECFLRPFGGAVLGAGWRVGLKRKVVTDNHRMLDLMNEMD
jgi:hypothetical protein